MGCVAAGALALGLSAPQAAEAANLTAKKYVCDDATNPAPGTPDKPCVKQDDGIDDTEGVRRAFQDALQEANPVLIFGRRGYDFTTLAPNEPLLNLSNVDGITIEGKDNLTTLTIHDTDSPIFFLRDSSNITIKGFNIRRPMAKLPFSQGTVKTIDAANEKVTVEVSNGFPSFAASQFTNSPQLDSNFVDLANPMQIKVGTGQNYPVDEDASGAYRIDCQNFPLCDVYLKLNATNGVDFDNIEEDSDGFILRKKSRDGHIVDMRDSVNITIRDMVSSEAPGVLVSGRHNENVTIDNFDSVPQAGHWASATAGGFNLGDTRGPVKVLNSEMEGLGDDFVNLHGRAMFVTENVAKGVRTYILKRQSRVRAGDTLTLVRVSKDGNDQVVSATETVLGQVDSFTDNESAGTITVTMADTARAPKLFKGDLIFNEQRMANEFEITNNVFRYGRRNGLLVRGAGKKINNNYFEHLGGRAIISATVWDLRPVFEGEAEVHYVNEGYALKGGALPLDVSGNIILNPSLAEINPQNDPGAIVITASAPGRAPFTNRVNKSIDLDNNRITNYDGNGILFRAAGDIELTNNVVLATNQSFRNVDNYMFRLDNSGTIRFRAGNNAAGDTRSHTLCLLSVNGSLFNGTDNPANIVWPDCPDQ